MGSSGDTSIATVDSNGRVTAVATGTATMTVATDDGDFTADCAVIVTEACCDNGIVYYPDEKNDVIVNEKFGSDAQVMKHM